jgi:3-oxoacyl-[acyl-carrier-protein] synthase II
MTSKRVVITGLGLVTSIGTGKTEFWRNLLAGKSGTSPVRTFDTSSYDVHLGAEIQDFQPNLYIRNGRSSTMGRCSQLAIAAARLALEDSGLNGPDLSDKTVGTVLGTTMGEPQVLEEIDRVWVQEGVEQIPPELVPRYACHIIPTNVAIEFGFHGPNMMIPTACSAGNYAIGYASDLLKLGRVDVAIAGGADCFSRIAFTGFARVGAIAPEICQPFDKNRRGMLVGEGACILILETLEHAKRRGAEIYAEVLGYGLGCDAYHMTGSHPEGLGLVRAMERALKQSGVSTEDVDYIGAHGTGTATNDRTETLAIKRVFSDGSAYRVPVSSIKSMIGHAMGAASAIEGAACVLSVRDNVVPPTMNYNEKDPDCDLDYVPNMARDQKVDIALNNSAAFGGLNAVLVLGKMQ